MTKRFLGMVVSAAIVIGMGGCTAKKTFELSTNTYAQKSVMYLYMTGSSAMEEERYSVYVNTYYMGEIGSNIYLPIEIPTGDVKVVIKHKELIRSQRETDTLLLSGVKSGEVLYVKAVVDNGPKLNRVGIETGEKEIVTTHFIDQGMDVSKLTRQISGAQLPLDQPRLLEPGKANIEPTSQSAYAPAAKQEDPTERIEKLYRLKEQGAITEEEYNTLKAKIIAE